MKMFGLSPPAIFTLMLFGQCPAVPAKQHKVWAWFFFVSNRVLSQFYNDLLRLFNVKNIEKLILYNL